MKYRIRKSVWAILLCVVLIMNGNITVSAENETMSSGDVATVSSGDVVPENPIVPQDDTVNVTVSSGDVQITTNLEVNAAINDNGDEDANTFEIVLEAWVAGTAAEQGSSTSETVNETGTSTGNQEEETKLQLDGAAVLKYQISQYFDYYCACEGDSHACIEVFSANWDGSQFQEAVPVDTAQGGLTVNVSGKTVDVTGFDYDEHMVLEGDEAGKGQKLIVKISVEPENGFWGGNNVRVGDEVSGIYYNGQMETPFAAMTANVPLSVDIVTADKTIYYGGVIADTDLLSGITAGYKTAGTAEGMVNVNTDGTVTPAESWMSDYAVISWNAHAGQGQAASDSSVLGNVVSKIGSGCYEYVVTAMPKESAVNAESTVATAAGAAIPTAGISDSDVGYAYVLIPVITFQNTVIYRGYIPNDTYFETYNRISSVEWVEMNGCSQESSADEDPYTYPTADPASEPTLTFTYEPADPTFSADTRVNVIVSSSNDNEAEGVFMWNAAVFGGLVSASAEDGDGYEFTVAVEYAAPFKMPDTGGIGTTVFTYGGMALLICAAMLILYKRSNRVCAADK